jgi:hypothetical protein
MILNLLGAAGEVDARKESSKIVPFRAVQDGNRCAAAL